MAYAVYGAGGFAREVAPLLQELWLARAQAFSDDVSGTADIVFVDDDPERQEEINGRKVIDFQSLLLPEHQGRKVIVAIGNGAVRSKIEEKCRAANLSLSSVFSPKATIMDEVEIGQGSVLCEGVIITSNVKIGRSFQANIQSYVAHDCVIGDYVTFAPRVACNGNVHIGDGVYVGTGAMIIQGSSSEPLVIGEGAVVGMGAVVTKAVEPYTLVVGNPARAIKHLPR